MGASVFDVASERLAPLAKETAIAHGVLAVVIAPGSLIDVVRTLKGEFAFDVLLDVTAVDWIGQAPRFEVVWHFYSTTHKVRVRLKTRVPEEAPVVDTLKPLYSAAGFVERECHEMYGVGFRGNDDLRPILLYEGFEGHPLRKDYPKEREQPLIPYRE